jgi:hypothetical protein
MPYPPPCYLFVITTLNGGNSDRVKLRSLTNLAKLGENPMTEKFDTETKIELFKIAAQLTKLAFENGDLQPLHAKYENDFLKA